jgi:hypothetical protein
MVDIARPALSELSEVVFEPERFELTDGRLELSGRWYGVEGRRFMRPSLIFFRDDGETRLLADLEHKPWAAESGARWHAAFPCDGEVEAFADAQLTVAPDLTVELPAPTGLPERRDAPNGAATHAGEAEQLFGAPTGEDDQLRSVEATAAPVPDAAPEAGEEGAQTQALSAARTDIAALRERVEEMASELERERSRFARELGEAQEATAEALRGRDEATAQRRKAIEGRQVAEHTIEQALAARGKAKRAGEQAAAEREEAVARLEQALAQRDEAVARLEQALAQRDEARSERDDALAQRERALTQRDEAGQERDTAVAQLDEAVAQLGDAIAQLDEALARRDRTVLDLNWMGSRRDERRRASWVAVAIPVIALFVVTLAVALILGSN